MTHMMQMTSKTDKSCPPMILSKGNFGILDGTQIILGNLHCGNRPSPSPCPEHLSKKHCPPHCGYKGKTCEPTTPTSNPSTPPTGATTPPTDVTTPPTDVTTAPTDPPTDVTTAPTDPPTDVTTAPTDPPTDVTTAPTDPPVTSSPTPVDPGTPMTTPPWKPAGLPVTGDGTPALLVTSAGIVLLLGVLLFAVGSWGRNRRRASR